MLADLLTARPPRATASVDSPVTPVVSEAVSSRQQQLGLPDPIPAAQRRRIYALHLRKPKELEVYQAVVEQPAASATERAGDVSLQPLLEHAEQRDVPVEVISFFTRHVARAIVRTAIDRDVDLVLMGSHRPLVGQAVLGGTVNKVLRRSPMDVAVLLHRGMSQVQRILVPYLGGRHDRLALQMAQKLGRNAGARVTVLHVVPEHRDEKSALNAAGAVESVFTNQDPDQPSPVEFRVVRDAEPVDAALREAQGFDLVIVGLGEEWGLGSSRFRFRRERFAAECPCPLLLVRKSAKRQETREEVEPIVEKPVPASVA
jgi:nucleotide-binding universal stress UspA family protein